MIKKPIDRVRYYLRKVNAYGEQQINYMNGRTNKKPPANRYQRLLAYKSAFHQRIEAERGGSDE